ncbi:hypothetical protein FB381_1277 [Nocardioides albertanoniae]|uniref:Small multi-drug export protein n=1 Tax=Nocardioides albertanoniae TaxID=1175486 RepID=A0A543A481_9ACTN|nr:hypothetical protein [Nocardioides albertanoniae]TQL67401.1 hypothetical protein FB381_1277 [Nocardioides albertanoniae]
MIETLQDFAQSFPGWLQWFAVFLVAAIPFVESYAGTLIGVAIGLHPAVAVSAAIAGNAAAVVLVVVVSSRIRQRLRAAPKAETSSPGRKRVGRLFQRFGIPGVSFVGHPTQISSAAMVGLGANPTKVLVWELTSIVVWGVAVAVLGGLGIHALGH